MNGIHQNPDAPSNDLSSLKTEKRPCDPFIYPLSVFIPMSVTSFVGLQNLPWYKIVVDDMSTYVRFQSLHTNRRLDLDCILHSCYCNLA